MTKRSESYAIFLAALSQETEQFFVSLQGTQELDSFLDNPRCPKVRGLVGRMTTAMTEFVALLLPAHAQALATHWDTLLDILRNPCSVQVNQYRTGNSFAYRTKDSFVDWADLQQMAHHGIRYFLSTKTQPPALFPASVRAPLTSTTRIETLTQLAPVLASLQEEHTYLLSVNKEASTKLYNACVAKKLHTSHTLIAENITGGNGKNLFMVEKSQQPCYVIG